jgi:hypothetical protein
MKDTPSFTERLSRFSRKKDKEAEDPFVLSQAELFGQLPQAIGPALFLDRFTVEDMMARLESSGLLSAMIQKGIRQPSLFIQRVDPGEHRLLIYDKSEREPMKIMELRMTLGRLELPDSSSSFLSRNSFEVLTVNWMMLQNPRARFSAQRPQLPGQEYPGLGLGRMCHEFLHQLGSELRRSGLVNHPQYFHNAVFYRDEYYFVDPCKQGELLAMVRDLSKYPMTISSPAVDEGMLMDTQRHQTIEWHPDAIVCPIRRRLRKYFESSKYRQAVEESVKSHAYDLCL